MAAALTVTFVILNQRELNCYFMIIVKYQLILVISIGNLTYCKNFILIYIFIHLFYIYTLVLSILVSLDLWVILSVPD